MEQQLDEVTGQVVGVLEGWASDRAARSARIQATSSTGSCRAVNSWSKASKLLSSHSTSTARLLELRSQD